MLGNYKPTQQEKDIALNHPLNKAAIQRMRKEYIPFNEWKGEWTHSDQTTPIIELLTHMIWAAVENPEVYGTTFEKADEWTENELLWELKVLSPKKVMRIIEKSGMLTPEKILTETITEVANLIAEASGALSPEMNLPMVELYPEYQEEAYQLRKHPPKSR